MYVIEREETVSWRKVVILALRSLPPLPLEVRRRWSNLSKSKGYLHRRYYTRTLALNSLSLSSCSIFLLELSAFIHVYNICHHTHLSSALYVCVRAFTSSLLYIIFRNLVLEDDASWDLENWISTGSPEVCTQFEL